MGQYLWQPKVLQESEIPEQYRSNFDFASQQMRFGKKGQSKIRRLYIRVRCDRCQETIWRWVGTVRRQIKKPDYQPLCSACAQVNWDKHDAKTNVPPAWEPYIHWDKREWRKRKLYVEVTCPQCEKPRFVQFESLSLKRRKTLKCRSCTGRAFQGTPSKPARRRTLKKEEVTPEFKQYCHFDQQKVVQESSGHWHLHILIDCPMCGQSRWKRVADVRYLGRPPFCKKCGVVRRYFLKPEGVRQDWRPFINFDSQQQRDGDKGPVVIQVQCPSCKEYRWMQLKSLTKIAANAPHDRLPSCISCGVKRAGSQRAQGIDNSRKVTLRGYIAIPLHTLSPEDRALAEAMQAHCKNKSKPVLEHRLVMARMIGRPLLPGEQVHHRNSDRADNRLANLRLVTNTSHPKAPKDKIAVLSVEIEALARELQTMQVDPLDTLKECFDTLERMVDSMGTL